jgi:hypothetical protein
MTSTSPLTIDDLLPQIKLPWGGRFFVQTATPSLAQINAAFDELVRLASGVSDADLGDVGLPAKTSCRALRRARAPTVLQGITVDIQYSVLVASFGRRPAFAPMSTLLEYRYGYVVMCEFKVQGPTGAPSKYLFVQRDLLGDPLEQMSTSIYSEIAAVNFLEPFLRPVQSGSTSLAPRLERLSMKIMASARGEVTRKIIEAYDIGAAISSLGLHRAVPGSMTIAVPRGAGIATVSVNPARQSVRASSSRRPLLAVVDWAAAGSALFHETSGVTQSCSSFIGGMAQPAGSIKGLTPRGVMIERHTLDRLLKQHADETGEVWTARKSTPPGWQLNGILDALSDLTFPLVPIPKRRDGTVIANVNTEPEACYDIQAPLFPDAAGLRLCVSSQSCKLLLPGSLGGLAVPGDKKRPKGLEELVNKFKSFRVVLGAGDVLFCSDGAYKASNLNLAVKQLLTIFEAFPMGAVYSEKGEAGAGATTFDPTSSFAAIEAHFKNTCDFLICDDGPTEWCDFLALTTAPPSMRWMHAKVQTVETAASVKARKQAKEDAEKARVAGQPVLAIPPRVLAPVATAPTLSASALEEVIGQAVKNLARLRAPADDVDFQAKRTDWVTNPCSLLGPAVISRLVKAAPGTTAAVIRDAFRDIAQHPLAKLEVAIVVPNYSQAGIAAAFGQISAGVAPGHVLQMFWLLSGFMHSCLEVGARPVVCVQP